MSTLSLLAAVLPQARQRYAALLDEQESFSVAYVSTPAEIQTHLARPESRTDVLIIDQALGGVFELVRSLRQVYPRLLIILVDEEADISIPGHADDVTTDPFTNGDLVRRIRRLVQERQTETLRADALPSIRSVAKQLRQASGLMGKADAAVRAILELGYDFVAFYRVESTSDALILSATAGPEAITSIAPDQQKRSTLPGWVAENGQSRIVGPTDDPNYILVARGRLGAGICVPVGSPNRYGVLVAGRDRPGSITQENVMLLELVSAQMAAALARETSM